MNRLLLHHLNLLRVLSSLHGILVLVGHGWQSQDRRQQLQVKLAPLIHILVLLYEMIFDLDFKNQRLYHVLLLELQLLPHLLYPVVSLCQLLFMGLDLGCQFFLETLNLILGCVVLAQQILRIDPTLKQLDVHVQELQFIVQLPHLNHQMVIILLEPANFHVCL